jgi:cell division protein FtsI (penicillin-binding protein 3)
MITRTPEMLVSRSAELAGVSKQFGLQVSNSTGDSYARKNRKDSLKINLTAVNVERQLKKGIMPDLSGLSAKDALYLLENNGMYVKLQGFGSVKKQSIEAGQRFSKGNKITLLLS